MSVVGHLEQARWGESSQREILKETLPGEPDSLVTDSGPTSFRGITQRVCGGLPLAGNMPAHLIRPSLANCH